MFPSRHFVLLAFQALLRNRMQTALAMLGVMIGVGALVTSLALGRGAQASVEDQLKAAGANLIVVTAGNYQKGKEDRSDPDGNIGHTGALELRDLPPASAETSARFERIAADGYLPRALHPAPLVYWRDAMQPIGDDGSSAMAPDGFMTPPNPFVLSLSKHRPSSNTGKRGSPSTSSGRAEDYLAPLVRSATADPRALLIPAHYEDDPLAIHDHPTAKDRLGDVEAGLGSAATLTRDDAQAIAAMTGVQYVVSGVHENAHIYICCSKTNTQWFTRFHGTEWALPEIRSGWVITHGRFLDKADAEETRQVMVLGKVAADKLFGASVNPVGQKVMLWNQPFEVIGIVSSRSWATQPAPGDDQFDAVYVPVTTINRLLNLSKLNTIQITSKSAGDVSKLANDVKMLLRQRHHITEAIPDDFTIATAAQRALGKGIPPQLARIISGNLKEVDQLTIEQLSSSLRRTNLIMLSLLASVAAVSLLVGGIGVMNLLLLSVTQRTREVGLRIALGARRSDIATQFVLEALLLCLAGGVLGILVGMLASGGLQEFFQWSAVISPLSALVALVVAALLGIAFSVYPARRASLLDPIEALRHE